MICWYLPIQLLRWFCYINYTCYIWAHDYLAHIVIMWISIQLFLSGCVAILAGERGRWIPGRCYSPSVWSSEHNIEWTTRTGTCTFDHCYGELNEIQTLMVYRIGSIPFGVKLRNCAEISLTHLYHKPKALV